MTVYTFVEYKVIADPYEVEANSLEEAKEKRDKDEGRHTGDFTVEGYPYE